MSATARRPPVARNTMVRTAMVGESPGIAYAHDRISDAIQRLERNVSALIKPSASASATTLTTISAAVVLVRYTATGTEGVDFVVPIGLTLPSAGYGLSWAPAGMAAIPAVDLPVAGRTTNSFRVLINAALTAGDVILFTVFA